MEGGAGSIPGQGTKMPHASAAWPNQINKSRAEWGGGKTNITHHQYGCGATQDSYTLLMEKVSLECSFTFSLKATCYHMSPGYLPKRNGSACPRKILNKEWS